MKKNHTIFAFICAALIAVPVTAAEPRNEKVNRFGRAYKTFKNDMKCMWSKATKCTPEQKRRIIKGAVLLLSLFVVLTGAYLAIKTRLDFTELSDADKATLQTSENSTKLLKEWITHGKIRANTTIDGYPLLLMAVTDEDLDLTSFLIDNGAHVNARDKGGDTALHIAVNQENIDVIRLLLKTKGIKANAKGAGGDTALHIAVRQKKPAIVNLLLNANADITIKNKQNESPLDIVKNYKSSSRTKKLVMKKAEEKKSAKTART